MHFRLKFQDKPLTQLNDNELINYISLLCFFFISLWFFYVVVVVVIVDFWEQENELCLSVFVFQFFQFNSYVKSPKIKPYVKNKSDILNVLKTGL